MSPVSYRCFQTSRFIRSSFWWVGFYMGSVGEKHNQLKQALVMFVILTDLALSLVLLWSIKFFTHRPHVKTDPFFFFNPIFVYKVRKKAEKTCIINAAPSFEWVRLEWATHGIVLLWVIKFSTHRPHVKTDRAGPVQTTILHLTVLPVILCSRPELIKRCTICVLVVILPSMVGLND